MPFWELSVPASPETSEGLTNLLWELGALGVVEEESPATGPHLRAFYPETAASTALERAVRGYLASLRALGLPLGSAEPRVTPLLDEAWAEAWRQAFAPLEVGRLIIAPPWDVPAVADGRRLVIIEPGRAFGTGSHGSTRGCLALLDRLLAERPVGRALDIGTGSGILAIAAARLGATRVTAIDTDPDAVTAARANAGLNGVGGPMEVRLTDVAGLDATPFPLILANLLAGTHRSLASAYRRLLAPGGALILGGVLADEAASVRAALTREGLAPHDEALVDGWASLRFRG